MSVVPSLDLPGSTSTNVTVEVLTTVTGFDELRDQWNALFDDSGFSVFQSFDWQRTWWKYYGEGSQGMRLRIIVVRIGDQVTAIAPFFLETLRAYGVLPVRRMGLLGSGQSDYLDFLVADGTEAVALDAIAAHLASLRNECDLIVIEDFSDRSPRNKPWFEALQKNGFDVEREVTDYCPRMEFKSSWPETLTSIPCNNNRKMEKFRRQIASKFNGIVEFTGESSSHGPDVDDFIRLHQQRWKRSGWPGLFEDPRYERFFREALEHQKRLGRLMLVFFRIEGDRRLGIVGFKHRDQFQYYLSGLGDPGKTAHHSPGLVLHIHCMEHLFDKGFRVYDFLRGSESYKMDLGGVAIPNWTISAVFRGGESARRNYHWFLLQHSLGRRLWREWLLLRLARKEYGMFTVAMRKHLARRWKSVLHDGFLKAKNPEQTIAAPVERKA